jgi:hypothetical protein
VYAPLREGGAVRALPFSEKTKKRYFHTGFLRIKKYRDKYCCEKYYYGNVPASASQRWQKQARLLSYRIIFFSIRTDR